MLFLVIVYGFFIFIRIFLIAPNYFYCASWFYNKNNIFKWIQNNA